MPPKKHHIFLLLLKPNDAWQSMQIDCWQSNHINFQTLILPPIKIDITKIVACCSLDICLLILSLLAAIFVSRRSTLQTAWIQIRTDKMMILIFVCFCLFDLIRYVPSTIFQLNRDGSSWVEPVLSQEKCVLLKNHNAVTPVSLEPAAPHSRVKHSTTEPLHSLDPDLDPNHLRLIVFLKEYFEKVNFQTRGPDDPEALTWSP